MRIRELNTGDTFRFTKGKATYVALNSSNTDEIGWIVDFANTKTGQRYQYQEPMWRSQNDPTKREVFRIKKQAVKPQSYHKGPDYRYADYISREIFERYFGIKMSTKTIVK